MLLSHRTYTIHYTRCSVSSFALHFEFIHRTIVQTNLVICIRFFHTFIDCGAMGCNVQYIVFPIFTSFSQFVLWQLVTFHSVVYFWTSICWCRTHAIRSLKAFINSDRSDLWQNLQKLNQTDNETCEQQALVSKNLHVGHFFPLLTSLRCPYVIFNI